MNGVRHFLGKKCLTPRRGSLLIITLWMVAILSVFAVAIARYLSTEIRVTKYRLAREEAKTLARSGVYLAMERLKQDAEEGVDWAEDDWSFVPSAPWVVSPTATEQEPSPEGDRVEISITDEERRLDLNAETTTKEFIDAVAGVPGIGQPIVNYHDPAKQQDEDQPEVSYYAKNGSIRSLDELLDIPEVRQKMQENPVALSALFEQATVYTEGHVNVNTASEQVLLAIKTPLIAQGFLTEGVIQAFVQRRGVGADGELGGPDDCLLTGDVNAIPQLEGACQLVPEAIQNLIAGMDYQSSVFRIVAKGVVTRPSVEYRVEAIVKRSGCPDDASSPCVVAWREG